MKRFLDLFWYSNGDYSIINGEVKFWERNLLTGYSRLIDTFTKTEILVL